MRNKFLNCLIVLSVLLFGTNISNSANAAVDLSDIGGSYARDAIQELVNKGILEGTGDGKFAPTANIERQDFAIILAKALNLDRTNPPTSATFKDVPPNHYAFPAIEAAVRAGLISGMGNGRFGTGNDLTREEMVVVFVRALGVDTAGMGDNLTLRDAGSISDWARDDVAAALKLKLISGNGDGTFNPSGSAERQAAALVASKFLIVKDNINPAPLPEPGPVEPNPEPQPEPGPVEPNPEPQPEPGPVEPNPEPQPEPGPVEPNPEPQPNPGPVNPNPGPVNPNPVP